MNLILNETEIEIQSFAISEDKNEIEITLVADDIQPVKELFFNFENTRTIQLGNSEYSDYTKVKVFKCDYSDGEFYIQVVLLNEQNLEKISTLEEENEKLKTDIKNINNDIEMLIGCILELSQDVMGDDTDEMLIESDDTDD